MNQTIQVIENRRSIRSFQDRLIDADTKDLIVHCAMRAPTAGNLLLYSIIEIVEQSRKDKLAISCDNQPFIAKAPLLLLFVADYQRWFDLFQTADVQRYCEITGRSYRTPGEGDLMLACCDALIAAQTAVIAAESLGIGSCYTGDIMENYAYHRELFDLPQYTFPIALVCFGYPKVKPEHGTPRLAKELVHFQDTYRRLSASELEAMASTNPPPARLVSGATNIGQHVYGRKFSADFSVEMTRSVREAIASWMGNASLGKVSEAPCPKETR